MDHYSVKPLTNAHVNLLQSELARLKVPHTATMNGTERILHIGPDADYELSAKPIRGGKAKVSIGIRYEHPGLKNILSDWMEKCGVEAAGGFYTWHMRLSPSVLNAIKSRWCIDLSDLPVTPVRFGQAVLVFMSGRNVDSEISSQLAAKPQRRLEAGEFIKNEDYVVKGEEFNTVAYAWRSNGGAQLYVVTSSAPALTLLSLWVISEGVKVETNLQGFN